MTSGNSDHRDSPVCEGGTIPGSGGQAAFRLACPQPSPIPIAISVPHAGRTYPARLVERMRNPGPASLRLEDRHADRLAAEVARQTGAGLVVAMAPRAMIDLNRSEEEMDWEMLVGGAPPGRGQGNAGGRARSGLGLVPRRLPGLGEIWTGRIEEADLRARIEGVHRPYHQAIEHCLRGLRERWGAALLIDLHSMPPLGSRFVGDGAPHYVVGDRFGATCDGALCAAAFDEFALLRQRAAHNRPYAGGYVLDRHSAPARGLHALQLEICRSTYLDDRLEASGPGFDGVVAVLVSLVRRLAGEVAALGRDSQLPQAAE